MMTYLPQWALFGGLQGPELLFLFALMIGGGSIILAALFFIFRGAAKSALKSYQEESNHSSVDPRK